MSSQEILPPNDSYSTYFPVINKFRLGGFVDNSINRPERISRLAGSEKRAILNVKKCYFCVVLHLQACMYTNGFKGIVYETNITVLMQFDLYLIVISLTAGGKVYPTRVNFTRLEGSEKYKALIGQSW